MIVRTVTTKVHGVTFEGRQAHIVKLRGTEPVRIVPEPENPHDSNALAVIVAMPDGSKAHVGYVPRDLAANIAPLLDGEQVMAKLLEVTGGFGYDLIYGLRIQIEYPEGDDDRRTA